MQKWKIAAGTTLIVLAMAYATPGQAFAQDTPAGGFVLMDIPYEQFYAAEAECDTAIDAVSSATGQKTRRMDRAEGSYHVSADGSDITGIIYPVYVEDLSVLEDLGGTEITEDSSVTITTTHKGEETTVEYTGSAVLFESPSYSWCSLEGEEEPALYKTMTVEDGNPVFSAIGSEPEVMEKATASFEEDDHKDYVIKVDGMGGIFSKLPVSGAILVADDGSAYPLRHIQNIYKKEELGFDADDEICAPLVGKTITQILFITEWGQYLINTDLPVQ